MKFSYKKGEELQLEIDVKGIFASIGAYVAAKTWRNPIPAIIFGVLGWKIGEVLIDDKEEKDGDS